MLVLSVLLYAHPLSVWSYDTVSTVDASVYVKHKPPFWASLYETTYRCIAVPVFLATFSPISNASSCAPVNAVMSSTYMGAAAAARAERMAGNAPPASTADPWPAILASINAISSDCVIKQKILMIYGYKDIKFSTPYKLQLEIRFLRQNTGNP